jgi:hypothetical protein
MTTRISSGPSTGVYTTSSAARVTAAPGQPFKNIMHAGAGAILTGAERAATRLPGGPILAAALRPGPGTGTGSSLSPEGASASTGAMPSAVSPPGGPGAGGEGNDVEAALSQSANQNLYFLEIQERISAESRSYTAISNVLKARHDTVKNAIGNIR